MAISPNRATLLAFDSVSNSAEIVSTATETQTGSIPLGGPTTSMVALNTGFGYAAVPAVPHLRSGSPPPGAIVAMNLASSWGRRRPRSVSPTRKPWSRVRMEPSFWSSAETPKSRNVVISSIRFL